ncbi:MAG: copper homeostasis protein CutC, partial [Geminicoccaceae bacterium]
MTKMARSDSNDVIAEICVDSIEGVRAAKAVDAARVELCSALLEGGLTPSFGMTKQAKTVAGPVGVHVMIRPRGGDFLYSDDEFAAMKDDIAALSELSVEGFVFGLLTCEGDVDVGRVAELTALCRPSKV